MDHFSRLKRQAKSYISLIILLSGSLILASWLILDRIIKTNFITTFVFLGVELIALTIIVPALVTDYLLEPIKVLWQAILHVSSESSHSPAPNLNDVRLGRELVTSLCLQIYQYASDGQGKTESAGSKDLLAHTVVNSLPIPLLVMDKTQTIIYANDNAHKYLGKENNELIGQNIYSCLDLSFGTEETFDKWLADARQNSISNSRSWERVHLKTPSRPQPMQIDMSAYYNKDNPTGVETIITLFDHTSTYDQEDNSISYVAMAVHELRTPLTLIRGYVELFRDELGNQLNPEQADNMVKMEIATKRLASFVNNILNISRIEANSLVLQLRQENWNFLVQEVAEDFRDQASARGKTIELSLDPKIPPVAADRLSLYEVLSNLLDNALKYIGDSKKIVVRTFLTDGGLVQTTVEDKGVGIPSNILPHLFEKYYRSHHTNDHILGTGLGLYISKTIVSAHGGNIWVRSFEGQGTIIGFTIIPYSQLAEEQKNGDNKDITRNANGWIKNHSYYRK